MKFYLHTAKIVALGVFVILSAFSVSAVNVTDTIAVKVNIGVKTMVDINPTQLVWEDIPPGTKSNSTYFNEVASGVNNNSQEMIQIENIGSTNITQMWLNTTYEDEIPFGTGDPSNYDAGNFIVVARDGSSDYFFVNRVEYNESNLIYLTVPAGHAHGRLRMANHEYFWSVDASTGVCNASNFRIGKNPHNQTELGTVDLTNCDVTLTGTGGLECREQDLLTTSDTTWGYRDLYVGPNGGYANYSVAVYYDCSTNVTAMFYHWNKDAPGAQETTGHDEYLKETPLVPGEHIVANVKVYIPYGVPAGNVTDGTLTVIAHSVEAS